MLAPGEAPGHGGFASSSWWLEGTVCPIRGERVAVAGSLDKPLQVRDGLQARGSVTRGLHEGRRPVATFKSRCLDTVKPGLSFAGMIL